jgi:quercetin 2,3-dioxygenase
MRTIKTIHQPEYAPMGRLVTYRVLPTRTLGYIDPFLFLNHHGPQVFKPNNSGLPFGPHPHRGIETVTFILEGDIVHHDNNGNRSTITAGGIQWMTAGRGIIHSENSSEAFLRNGGPLEILQLWINLPAKHKMIAPFYKGFEKHELPTVTDSENNTEVTVLSGSYLGTKGAVESVSGCNLFLIRQKKDAQLVLEIPRDHNIFFYIIRGAVKVNNAEAEALHLVEFINDEETVNVKALENATIILGHAKPFNEPVVSAGPFVMNTEEEIDQAYRDYEAGRF